MGKSILVSIIAVIVVLTLLSLSVVGADTGALTTNWRVTVNGNEDVGTSTIQAIEAGQTIPIKLVFDAIADARDVTVKAWIDGYRSDIMDKTRRFELVNGSEGYTKYLSLEIPSDIDPTEEYNLVIRISGRDEATDETESDELEYTLMVQRGSYTVEVLFVEMPEKATPGEVIPIEIVLKNWGMNKLEDVFVKVRIPDLSIEKKVYFNDIDPLDEDEVEEDVREANRHDSVERKVYLEIPENAKSGVYNVEIEAYNVDSSKIVKKNLIVSREKISDVLTGTAVKALSIGEEKSYDLTIINTGDKLKVYTLTPEEIEGLIVEVEPIVSVLAGSSEIVKVKVKATESAKEGTHLVTIKVESEGELVKTVNFTANVEKVKAITRANTVVVLTVVLVIVFIVLLIILLVLLTRKPASVETEETSYY